MHMNRAARLNRIPFNINYCLYHKIINTKCLFCAVTKYIAQFYSLRTAFIDRRSKWGISCGVSKPDIK